MYWNMGKRVNKLKSKVEIYKYKDVMLTWHIFIEFKNNMIKLYELKDYF